LEAQREMKKRFRQEETHSSGRKRKGKTERKKREREKRGGKNKI